MPVVNHSTSVEASCTAISAASGDSSSVGVCAPWRDVWPSHSSDIIASTGATSPIPSLPGIANRNLRGLSRMAPSMVPSVAFAFFGSTMGVGSGLNGLDGQAVRLVRLGLGRSNCVARGPKLSSSRASLSDGR